MLTCDPRCRLGLGDLTNFQTTAMGNLASLGSIAALQAQGIASLAQANLASAHLAATNNFPSASMAGSGGLGGNGNAMGYGYGFGLGGITGLGLGAGSLSGARGGLEGLSLGPFSPGGANIPRPLLRLYPVMERLQLEGPYVNLT